MRLRLRRSRACWHNERVGSNACAIRLVRVSIWPSRYRGDRQQRGGPAGAAQTVCHLMIIASKKPNVSNNDYVLLDLQETSALTRVPVHTLKDWRAKGGVRGPRSHLVGGRVMYRQVDAFAWLDDQLAQTGRGGEVSRPVFTPLGRRSLSAA